MMCRKLSARTGKPQTHMPTGLMMRSHKALYTTPKNPNSGVLND